MKALQLSVLFLCFAWCIYGQADENGFIPGPGGALFHPDCHVVLPEGSRMVDSDTIVHADGTEELIRPCARSPPASNADIKRGNKREANGWNTYSRYFMNAYLDAFSGDWVVPNNPVAGYTGQLLYFFTGLEDASCNCILQPVVWYGVSPAGGGAAWYAAVWYVYNNNANYITSAVVQVYPGWYISTYMQRTPGTGWACGMIANGAWITGGYFPDVLQSNAYCTLEIYNVPNCLSLPLLQATTFQNLAISQHGVGAVGFNNAYWNIYVTQTDCAQSMSCNGNTCTMTYGVPCPANAGSSLTPNAGISSVGIPSIVSPGCYYRLYLQGDGNLVLYNALNQALWYTSTSNAGPAPYSLIMQGDGNLVLYDGASIPRWTTGPRGAGAYLVLQTDGNLVIYSPSGAALWSTGPH